MDQVNQSLWQKYKKLIIAGGVAVVLVGGITAKNIYAEGEVEKELNQAISSSPFLKDIEFQSVSCSGVFSTDCTIEDIKTGDSRISSVEIENIKGVSDELKKYESSEEFHIDTSINITDAFENSVKDDDPEYLKDAASKLSVSIDAIGKNKKIGNATLNKSFPKIYTGFFVVTKDSGLQSIVMQLDSDTTIEWAYNKYSSDRSIRRGLNKELGAPRDETLSFDEFKNNLEKIESSLKEHNANKRRPDNMTILIESILEEINKGSDTVYVELGYGGNLTPDKLAMSLMMGGGSAIDYFFKRYTKLNVSDTNPLD
ncbi:MAG: hypothetical protein ACOC08_05835 [Campylobacterales bacterium]